MIEISRREAFLTAAAAAAMMKGGSAAAALAQAAAEPGGAMWDLTDLYPSDAAWEAERQALIKAVPTLTGFRGKLGTSAATLREALELQTALTRRAYRLYAYASLKADEDLRVSANQERQQQTNELFTSLGEASAWMAPEILKVGKPRIDAFVAADPGLKKFSFQLADTLRQAPHTLGEEAESILASVGSPLSGPQEVRDQLAASDIPRPTVKLSDGRSIRLDDQGYTLARNAPNRADRKLVFDKFWGSYKGFENSLGASLAAKVRGDIFAAKARKYENSLEAALSGPNLPQQVYRSLIAETNRGLPVLHRYFELRRKMLGLPDIGYWDIYPPLVKSDRKFTLEQMRELTMEAVRPLGADYGQLFAKASAANWMDPWPRQGKASGAYMQPAAYGIHPYLLLNLSDQYDGLTTYAHEWGHAMHTLLSHAAQPFETAFYPTFTAEVASTAQELLLVNMMRERAQTRDEKLYILGQLMEQYRGTFYRQAMLSEFELAIHELAERGEGLSGAKMSGIYMDLLRRYHGPNLKIEPDYATEWAYISHYYRNFYLFQYATSITAANYFAEKIRNGTDADRARYLAMLRAGGTDYGYNLLKTAGLDMATAAPYRLLVETFSKVLDEAEALI